MKCLSLRNVYLRSRDYGSRLTLTTAYCTMWAVQGPKQIPAIAMDTHSHLQRQRLTISSASSQLVYLLSVRKIMEAITLRLVARLQWSR